MRRRCAGVCRLVLGATIGTVGLLAGCSVDRGGLFVSGGRDASVDATDAATDAPDDSSLPDAAADAGADAGASCADVGAAPRVVWDFERTSSTLPLGVPDVADADPRMDLRADTRVPTGVSVAGGAATFSGGRFDATLAASQALGAAVTAAGAFAVELWVSSPGITADGPDRIITCSSSQNQRAFTVGQEGADVVFRVRSTATDVNGTELENGDSAVPVAEVFPATAPRHVVAVFGEGEARLYVDGVLGDSVLHAASPPATPLWADTERCALGDELNGAREWSGVLHHVAFYSRALSAAEIACRAGAGVPAEP